MPLSAIFLMFRRIWLNGFRFTFAFYGCRFFNFFLWLAFVASQVLKLLSAIRASTGCGATNGRAAVVWARFWSLVDPSHVFEHILHCREFFFCISDMSVFCFLRTSAQFSKASVKLWWCLCLWHHFNLNHSYQTIENLQVGVCIIFEWKTLANPKPACIRPVLWSPN